VLTWQKEPLGVIDAPRAEGIALIRDLYPNPLGRQSTLKVKLTAEVSSATITVRDFLGRQIARKTLTDAGESTHGRTFSFHHGMFPGPGAYVLSVSNANAVETRVLLVE
jgi:hypothetical protein